VPDALSAKQFVATVERKQQKQIVKNSVALVFRALSTIPAFYCFMNIHEISLNNEI